MKYCSPIVIFISALSGLLTTSHSLQAQNSNFRRLAPPEGNSFGTVTSIAQDKKGYMWFSAQGGLWRYDGYNLTTYVNDPMNPNSLGSTQLESLLADKDGILWIGTQGYGLDRFDPNTGIFTHYRHDPADPSSITHNKITVLVQDRDGVLWIGTHGGLDRFDPKTNTFYHYRHNDEDPNSLSCDQVRSIYEDRQGTIWVGTGSPFLNDDSGPEDGGLNRLDKKTGRFTRYLHHPGDPHSLINNKVCGMLEDSHGTFWVGTAGDGLHTMDRINGVFERHPYEPAHPHRLSRPPLAPIVFDHIRFIAEDVEGYIWIGTVLAGMNRYDPHTKRVTHFEPGQNSSDITDNTSWSEFTSREGVMWIGSWNGNIYHMDPQQKNISHTYVGSSANSFLEEDSNMIWIGTNQGVIRTNRKTGLSKQFTKDEMSPRSLSNDTVNNIYEDYRGDIWVGTLSGLNRYNKNTGDFTRFVHDEDNEKSLTEAIIFDITEDPNGSLWLATQNGVDRMDREKNVFTHYISNPEDTTTLSQKWVSTILRDASGNLWTGSPKGGGINRLDRKTGKFKHYLLGTSIACLFEDGDSVLWAGTDGGFFRYDKSTDVFLLFLDPQINKTESINVFTIVEDDSRNLWMATSSGILKLNSLRDEIRIYRSSYGVNSVDFSDGAYKGLNGKIYIGDATGYFSFFPDSISGNVKPPQIVFTDFRLNEESIKPGNNSPVKVALDDTKEIMLNHAQNIFSFDFVGIHYSNPESNKHLFMLENYDNAWRQSGTEHTAYYYNIPPGRYIFRVKASSPNGVWAEKSVTVVITPPWWLTWWAYAIYGVLLVGVVYSVHRFQKARVIRAEREKTRERELAQSREIEKAYHELRTTQSQLVQSEKMASLGELTAGIAHEIQNPLNFVNNFSEVNAELIDELEQQASKGNLDDVKAIAKDIKGNEQKIIHHGKRADAIVKGMLQHSRASSGQKEPTDINALCDEYLRLSYHGLRAKDITFNAKFETDFDTSIEKLNIIPQEIGRVILNLINNAFYAVSEKSKQSNAEYEPAVIVSSRKSDSKVVISVEDNGNGIPESIKEKIFQPFFTTKPTGQGTGLGLSLSYDIVKAHGGELKVETEEGEGSEFIIQLPVV
jgi:signal transduction histidine kinase/ligand-binding sensor domain-containing protein